MDDFRPSTAHAGCACRLHIERRDREMPKCAVDAACNDMRQDMQLQRSRDVQHRRITMKSLHK